MAQFSFIQQYSERGVSILTLHRPEKCNAINEQFISELKYALKKAEKDENSRVILIKAEGENFCAGADLNWIKRRNTFTHEKNKADALKFADLLQFLSCLLKPTIILVQGYAMGGGVGLVACCDIAIAERNAQFCFPEVKLGLIPATIAPYIIRSIGYSAARRYFLTAELFDSATAKKIGLVHQVADASELLSIGYHFTESIMKNDMYALSITKNLLNDLCPISKITISKTTDLLANIWTSSKRISMELNET